MFVGKASATQCGATLRGGDPPQYDVSSLNGVHVESKTFVFRKVLKRRSQWFV
jgi:hypothetical protein